MRQIYSRNARPITADQVYKLQQLGVLTRKMPKFHKDAIRLIQRLSAEMKHRQS